MEKKLVAIVSNDPAWTYNLRREVIEGLLGSGYRVALIVGYGEKLEPLIEMGCEHYDVPLERHGMNPIHELQLIGKYRKVLKQIRPDAVLTYTLKPNSYAGFLCRKMKIPYIANVTGLGNPIQNGGIVQKITLALLKGGVKKAKTVFFQNAQNKDFLLERKIVPGGWRLLPGSGVNTGHFALLPDGKRLSHAEILFRRLGCGNGLRLQRLAAAGAVFCAVGAIRAAMFAFHVLFPPLSVISFSFSE